MGENWLQLSVPGHAAGLTATRAVADPWKMAVWREAQVGWSRGVIREPCSVRLTFNVTAARFRDTAVFNLLKSTIDGLGRAIFAQVASGQPGPWGTEDWWITHLVARKKLVEHGPSVDITVGSATPGVPFDVPSSAVRLFVSGEPPLWPGDSAGQTKVLEWRRRLAEIASSSDLPAVGSRSMALDFRISSDRMKIADIDNFCVPAAQAVSAAAYGDLRHGPAITEIVSTKTAVAREELGTDVRVW